MSMRKSILVAAIVSVLSTPHLAVADNLVLRANENGGSSLPSGPLKAAALREVLRLTNVPGHAASQRTPQRRDSWIGRHPVLFGSLVGLGLGVGVSAAALPESENPDVTKGQYVTVFGFLGLAAGAGVGALISMVL